VRFKKRRVKGIKKQKKEEKKMSEEKGDNLFEQWWRWMGDMWETMVSSIWENLFPEGKKKELVDKSTQTEKEEVKKKKRLNVFSEMVGTFF
jgi:hypothetical protein